MNIEIDGFHRGLTTWVAVFFIRGYRYIAYRDRELKCWLFAHQDRFELEEMQIIEKELTESLKNWLNNRQDNPKS